MLRIGKRAGVVAVLVLVAAVVGLVSSPAQAATDSYDLTWWFSGDQPASISPFGTILFEDISGGVRVTMTADLEAASEFISWWGFSTGLSVYDLTFSAVTGAASATISAADCTGDPACGEGVHKADGDGFYDIVLQFDTSEGAGRLLGTESVTFTITGSGVVDVDIEDFTLALSSGSASKGTYHTAAHIQGIPGGCSGWVGDADGVPGGTGTGPACKQVTEPSMLLFVGLGLAGVMGLSRRFMAR